MVRDAVRDLAGDLVALVRSADPTATAVGHWSVGDVAAHLCHVLRFDIDALTGQPVPDAVVTRAGMADLNARLLAEDGDRDPTSLADRLEALTAEFLAAPEPHAVRWLQGLRMPASAVAGHLLEECLMHGHDIASAAGRSWPIRRDHALLAIEAGVLPLIEAMPPAAFVNQDKDFRARVEVRPRGGTTRVLDFADRRLTLHPAGTPTIDAPPQHRPGRADAGVHRPPVDLETAAHRAGGRLGPAAVEAPPDAHGHRSALVID